MLHVDNRKHSKKIEKRLRMEMEAGGSKGSAQGQPEYVDTLIEQLQELMQQREDFVAALTHDLKTPVNTANRAIELLLDGVFGPLREEQAVVLRAVLESNKRMNRLLSSLLELHSYESGTKQLCLKSHNLYKLAGSVVDKLATIAEEKGVSINFEQDGSRAVLVCDEEEIRRVIWNLLDNAVKFTAAGGRVDLEIEQSAHSTSFSVRDNGQGISELDRAKLFQRFWTPCLSGRPYASTGTGLYLCRKIVELHSGKISCDSSSNKGSRFCLELPTAGPTADDAKQMHGWDK